MGKKKSSADKFPHVKGLVRKATKFGHRWILSAPDSTGKIKNITVKISDNDTIEEFYRKVSEARTQLITRSTRKTFDAWLDEYITIKQLSKNSTRCVKFVLSQFSFDNVQNRKIVTQILASGRNQTTIKNRISQVNAFFNWLCQKVPEVKNPALDVKVKAIYQPRRRIATDEEIEALLKRVRNVNNKEYLLFVLLLIHTGARLSTICCLAAKDMDETNHLSLYNAKTKKRYDYLIPVQDEETIRLWREITADGKLWHIPPTRYYYRLNNLFFRMFKPDETGERLSIHSLRHTFATNAVRAGIPIEIVSKLLDHSSPAITLKVYAKFAQSQIDSAIANLNLNTQKKD